MGGTTAGLDGVRINISTPAMIRTQTLDNPVCNFVTTPNEPPGAPIKMHLKEILVRCGL